MNTEFTRRSLLKAAGLGAGVAIATTYSPFSYAQNEKVRVASIGTGAQGCFHLGDGLARASNIQMIAVCDVYKPQLEEGWKKAGGGEVKKYMDYREMLEKEKLDAVVIATPLVTHYQITTDCLDAGKYVFCEKTMCYSIEDARNVVKKCHEKGRFVQVGHQRRYNPTYNHALKMAREEAVIGRINHIDCQWHRNNEWRRDIPKNYVLSPDEAKWITDLEHHLNWRLYKETSGGLMTELATHALDVVNWYLDANPTRVFGYGGLDYWRDGRTVFDNVNVAYEYQITDKNGGYRPIEPRDEGQKENAELNAAYTVRCVYSSISANAQRGASETFQGDEGAFVLSEYGSYLFPEPTAKVKWADKAQRDADQENAVVITSGGTLTLSNKALKNGKPFTVDTDKSVDQLQFEAFAHDVQTNGTPRANQMVGLQSAICALTGLMAMEERREILVDPAWYKFDFETPPTALYG